MPIMAVQDQNDVRGSTRVLARAAKRYVETVPDDFRHLPAINGMFHLLQEYAAHGLRGYEYEPGPEWGAETMSTLSPANRHVADLRSALDGALQDVSENERREHVLRDIERVLYAVASKSKKIDEVQRERASRFLASLLNRLSVAG